MSSPASRRARVRAIVGRVAVLLLGFAALAWSVRDIGLDRLLAIARGAAVWLPLAIGLDGARIAFEALSTRVVLGERGRAIPFRALYLAQLAGHGVMGVMPAGRSASEAAKATLLSAWLPIQVAVAMGATNQANVLIGSAIFSLFCLAGALAVSSDSTLATAIVVHFFVLMGSGVGLRWAATDPRAEKFLAARAPWLAERARLFHEASRDTPLFAPVPVLLMMMGRLVQTAQYAVLAMAVGIPIDLASAFAVQGANLVAAMVGVLVPGQVGTAELVFRLAAEALDTEPAAAVSIALLARIPQVLWVAAGLLVLAVWRARREAGTA